MKLNRGGERENKNVRTDKINKFILANSASRNDKNPREND